MREQGRKEGRRKLTQNGGGTTMWLLAGEDGAAEVIERGAADLAEVMLDSGRSRRQGMSHDKGVLLAHEGYIYIYTLIFV